MFLPKPTHNQLNVLLSEARRIISYCGRRGGKTHFLKYKALERAVNYPNSDILYVAPTYRQAKELFWYPFKNIVPHEYISKKNESSLKIEFINGSIVRVYGGRNYDSMRGLGLDLALVDETSDQSEELYREVLNPALADKKGSIVLAGTPKGFDWVYDLKDNDGWEFYSWTTLEGGLVDKEEVERAKLELDPKTFRQEYEASFENYSGIIFHAFSDENVIEREFKSGLPTTLTYDFNVNPMSILVIQEDQGKHYVVKEFQLGDSNTEAATLRAVEYLKENNHSGIVYVTGDSTGNNRSTIGGPGKTNYTITREILESNGFNPEIYTPRVKSKEDAFNLTNGAFKNYKGEMKLFIDNNCNYLIKNLKRVTREDYDKKDPKGVTHIVDALTYYPHAYLKNNRNRISVD